MTGFAKRPRFLSALAFAAVVVAVLTLRPLLPADVRELGAWCVLPCALTVIWTFLTRRVVESVTLGLLTGCALCHAEPAAALTAFSKSLTGAIRSEDIAWLFIVCGLMGGLIVLVSRSGGAWAFGEWAARHAKGQRSALLWTWALGSAIFIDDYLNSMTVGSSMSRLTDRHRAPREMLAYVADSTAAPLCVLVPFTTWAAFAGRLLVSNGWTEPGASEIGIFARTIPYNLYAWIAALIVPLVILGVLIGATVLLDCDLQLGVLVALPVVIPLARQFGTDLPLAVAACLSAGVFGSHVSFCSDATVLSSSACGCDNYRHAVSQMPYGLFAAGLSALGFLALGYLKTPL